MQKKQFFSTGIIALLLVTSFLVLDNSGTTAEKQGSICCKKAIKQCSGGFKRTSPAENTLENINPGFSSLIFNFSS